jgi:hypothetical protein
MAITIPSNLQLQRESITKARSLVRGLNVFTALVQLAAGLGSVSELLVLDVAGVLIALYAALLALVLLLYECRFGATDAWLRANFGFLFSYRGLAAYLLFLGVMDLGMVGKLYGLVAGGAACSSAALVVLVGVCSPRASRRGPTAFPAIYLKSGPSYGSSAGNNSACATPLGHDCV